MRARGLIGVIAYAFVASFVLEKLKWLGWLTAVWPVVLLIPVIYVLTRYRRPLRHFVAYLSAGLAAALAGFALALHSMLRNTELGTSGLLIIALSAIGVAAYSAPLLAIIVTLVASIRDSRPEVRIDRFFHPGSAWMMLVAAFLLVEAFVFGMFAKDCNGIGWGLYGIMFSPAYLEFMTVRVWTGVGIVTALVFGGFLPRVIRLKPRTALFVLVVSVIVICAIGFAVTPAQRTACQAV